MFRHSERSEESIKFFTNFFFKRKRDSSTSLRFAQNDKVESLNFLPISHLKKEKLDILWITALFEA